MVVAGIVLLVGGIVFFASRGKSTDPGPPPKTKAVDPIKIKRDDAMIWMQGKLLDGPPLTGARLDALLAIARKRGYHLIPQMGWDRWKKKAYARLLGREPNHPEANRAFGRIPISDYPDFRGVFKRLRHWASMPPEFERFREALLDRVETRPKVTYPAYEPAEFERVRALLDRFRKWDEAMRNDPTRKAIHAARARVKTDPILGKYEFVHIELHPWVLFYASRKLVQKDDSEKEARRVEAERARLKKRLDAFRPLVTAYLEFFRKRWLKPLGLKEFAKDELFMVWVFAERETWQEYGKKLGTPPTPGMLGYFDPKDHWVFLFEDKRNPINVESSLSHELTHQLHWHFSHEPDKGTGFFNHFRRVKAVWFQEGWAEYVGWTKKTGARYEFGVPSKVRVNSLRLLRKHGVPLFPVRDLVRRTDYMEWMFHIMREWLPRQRLKIAKPELLIPLFMEMLYAQSWLLVSFLYEYEDGKYRKKALKFTAATLKGYLGHRGASGYAQAHEVFEEIFGLRTHADWARFQKEYEEYLTAMFYSVGK